MFKIRVLLIMTVTLFGAGAVHAQGYVVSAPNALGSRSIMPAPGDMTHSLEPPISIGAPNSRGDYTIIQAGRPSIFINLEPNGGYTITRSWQPFDGNSDDDSGDADDSN